MIAAAPIKRTAGTRTAVLEIVVQDVAGARAALAGGADRLELCSDLRTGGLTPSAGTVEAVLAAVAGHEVTVHALVRCRPGGYVYDDDEVDTMCRDIRALHAAGAHGVVVGALTPAQTVDGEALARFVDAAGGMDVTFHRAIDACPDPVAELEQLAGTGVGRVLTSGGAVRAQKGLNTLAAMAQAAPAGIEVMAGGGVQLSDIPALVGLGVDAVHLSARESQPDRHPAGPGDAVAELDFTSANIVAQARLAVAGLSSD